MPVEFKQTTLPNGLNISAGYMGDLGNGFSTQQLRASIQLPF